MCGGRPRATEAARWRRRKSSTASLDGNLHEQSGSPLVRRHLGHRQRNAFLMRPKKPPSLSSARYGSSPSVLLELLDQRALRFVEPARNVDARMHVEVAAPPAFERRHALPAEHLHVARLGARRDLDLDLARPARARRAWCRAPPASSSGRRRCGGRRRRARCRAADVTPTWTKRSPGGPAELAGVPLAANADPLPVGDPGGDVDVDRAVVQRAADPVAGGARRLDDAAEPSQRGQVPVRTNWPKTLCETCWTRPAPPQTSHVTGDGARGGAVAAARLARLGDPRRHADRDPGERLRERDLGARDDVATARRPAAARLLAEERLAEERTEDVREVPEVEVGRREPAAREGPSRP